MHYIVCIGLCSHVLKIINNGLLIHYKFLFVGYIYTSYSARPLDIKAYMVQATYKGEVNMIFPGANFIVTAIIMTLHTAFDPDCQSTLFSDCEMTRKIGFHLPIIGVDWEGQSPTILSISNNSLST